VIFTDGRTVSAKLTMTLESTTGSIQPRGSLTLLAGTGMVLHNDVTSTGGGLPVTLNADYELQGDGTISVAAGKTINTQNGDLLITAFDIDLQSRWESNTLLEAILNAGIASISIHAAKTDQSIGLGPTSQDMHVTDSEIGRIIAGDTVTFSRLGDGAIVVQSVTQKYSTKANSIVFGDPLGNVVTSASRQAALPQVNLKSYATAADFVNEPKGLPRLEVPSSVSVGSDIVVRWFPDIYSERVSHKYDWVGLYKKGECSEEDGTPHHLLHKCHLAWKYTPGGFASGETRFTLAHYKGTGVYETRYFYGDSTDGQGYRCVTLGGITDTYKHCILSARQVSSSVTIGDTGTVAGMSSVPGLLEKVCDGSKKVCE